MDIRVTVLLALVSLLLSADHRARRSTRDSEPPTFGRSWAIPISHRCDLHARGLAGRCGSLGGRRRDLRQQRAAVAAATSDALRSTRIVSSNGFPPHGDVRASALLRIGARLRNQGAGAADLAGHRATATWIRGQLLRGSSCRALGSTLVARRDARRYAALSWGRRGYPGRSAQQPWLAVGAAAGTVGVSTVVRAGGTGRRRRSSQRAVRTTGRLGLVTHGAVGRFDNVFPG